MIKKASFCFLSLIVSLSVLGKTVYDTPQSDLKILLRTEADKYVIRFKHVTNDTIHIPACNLIFKGGRIAGHLIFENTQLSGKVDLHGSTLNGIISNKVFNALWLCYGDGKHDDANSINEILNVCNEVYFPKGTYFLSSQYDSRDKVPSGYWPSIHAHIGINRDNIVLEGNNGTVFETFSPLGTICIFSQPYQINKSVKNITIRNITFNVHNNGKDFYEHMHTITSIGVDGLVIKNCVFNDFWGDAISLSHYGDTPETGERTRNQNVTILKNKIIGGELRNNRNGISVVSGKNVLIKNNTIKRTSRKDMPGGIDVEPNNTAYTVEDIRIEGNSLSDIQGCNGAISVVSLKNGPVCRVTIKDNTITNCSVGLFAYITSFYTTSDIRIISNRIDKKTVAFKLVGKGKSRDWQISDNIIRNNNDSQILGDIGIDNLLLINNYFKNKKTTVKQ